MITVYIGVGSNLNEPVKQVRNGMMAIANQREFEWVAASYLYHTTAYGLTEQPDFINAVIKIKTHLSADDVLTILQKIENTHDRKRQIRWGPRTLDLDILLYGSACIDLPHLKIPHPDMRQRDFVLYPLLQIEPDFCFSDGLLLRTLCEKQFSHVIPIPK